VVVVFLLWVWVATRATTLPVGETGVARARAAGVEGDHPACTSGFPELRKC
jgi:hypothetical protein